MTQANPLNAYATRKDAEAFAQVVERYQRLILATCRRRLQNAADVDDAVQETFLRLAQRAGQVHTNLGAWLHTCAVNVSIDINRRQLSRARHESAAAKPAEPLDDPKRTLAELREHLDAALQKLDAEQRELIIQRYFIGRSQIELAEEAGVAPSTIGHRLEKAVERLRLHLKTMGCVAAIAGGAAALTNLLEAESASATVSPALTANVMRIGLSGVPAARGALLGGLLFKLFALAAAALLIAAGIWFSIPHHQSPVAQTAPPAPVAPQSQTSGTPAITVSPNHTDQSIPPPHWDTTQPANTRAVLAGRVLDSGGKPIANATVTLSNVGHAVTKSDAQGNYSFATITRSGEGRIDVEADGFVPIDSYRNENPPIQLSPQSQARRDLIMERGVRVTVTLTDKNDQPVRRARVEANVRDVSFRGRNGPSQDSDAQGEAHLVLPISKTPYVISATFEGCAPAHATITADSADKPQDVNLYLGPGMSVMGTAICSDGKPAAGWELVARPDWWSSNGYPAGAKIDKDGNFKLTDVLAGQYELQIDVPSGTGSTGYRLGSVALPPTTQPLLVHIPLPSPSSLTKLTGHLRITGGRPRFLNISAWNQATGENYNSMIMAPEHSPREWRQGIAFSIDNIPPGIYNVNIESDELEPVKIEKVVAPGDLSMIDAKFLSHPVLHGTVVDASTGQPIAHFAVRARKVKGLGDGQDYSQDNSWTQVSDPRGRFNVQLEGSGIYQAQVSLSGYAWIWSPEVRVEKSGSSEEIQIKATAGGSLGGQILDPAGKPIAGAKVIPLSMAKSVTMQYVQRFESDAGAAITDSSGRFVIPHLAPGEETLKILHHDFAPLIKEKFKVTENQVNDIGTINLKTGGGVEGVVFDQHGVPSPAVSLQFQDADGGGPDDQAQSRFAIATTDDQGHYRVEHLPQQIVYVNYADHWDHPRKGVIQRVVRPLDGNTAHLDFGGTLPVKGRLLSDSKPLPNSPVALAVKSPNFGPVIVESTTDADGRFLFMGPPVGRYTLFFQPPESRSDWIDLKTVDVSNQPIDLGDVFNDVGDVTIAISADDPADLQAIQSVSVRNDDARGEMWKPIAQATSLPSAPNDWRAPNVPAGHFRIEATLRGDHGTTFLAPFDRKPLVGQTRVELHLPRASATLKVTLKNPTGDATKPSYARLRSQSMSTTISALPLQPTSLKLPPGSYRVLDVSTPAFQPRSDIPPIVLAEGDSKKIEIDLTPSPENRRVMVNLSVWSADGVLVTDASKHLLDAGGNTIESTRLTNTDDLFVVRPGRYHAVLERPGGHQSTQEIEVPSARNGAPFQWQNNIDLNLPPEN